MNYRSYFRKRLKLRKIAFDKEEAQTMDKNTTESDKKKYPWTLKRAAALFAVILLVTMYLLAFVSALFRFPGSAALLRISLALTVVLPLFLWILIWGIGFLTHKKNFASVNLFNSNPEERRKMEEALAAGAAPSGEPDGQDTEPESK